jgi:hypothetical protein
VRQGTSYLILLGFSKSKDDIGIWSDFSNAVLESYRVFHQKPELSADVASQHYVSRKKWITLNILSEHESELFVNNREKVDRK